MALALPDDWRWDSAIKDLASLKRNVELYAVLVPAEAAGITGVMLEALADDSLPDHGPGRAVNGNFSLTPLGPQRHWRSSRPRQPRHPP